MRLVKGRIDAREIDPNFQVCLDDGQKVTVCGAELWEAAHGDSLVGCAALLVPLAGGGYAFAAVEMRSLDFAAVEMPSLDIEA